MIERVKLKDKEIILVGTAHISNESVKDVKKAVEKFKPDVIGIELDSKRLYQLKHPQQWNNTSIGSVLKSGQTGLFLLNLFLANMQKKLGESVGIKPGSEMLSALKIAQEKNLPVALLDRDLKITMQRAMQEISLIEKLKLGFFILASFFGLGKEEISKEKIEALKDKDMLTEVMNELAREAPKLKKVLVDERDSFIAKQLQKVQGKTIVAVLGAGHLQGVKKMLFEEINEQELVSVKKKKSVFSYLKWLVPVIFIAILGYAFYVKGFEASLELFLLWFLVNGVLSAIGVLLARGHILTILSAFLAAPFTSLHPMIAAGWVAGAVELKMRNPKVKDFNSLNKINSFKDLTKNQVTRILLVVVYANVGSTIGTIIALPWIISLL
ncbi:MAG: TraB/GumN family protein [archaeon]